MTAVKKCIYETVPFILITTSKCSLSFFKPSSTLALCIWRHSSYKDFAIFFGSIHIVFKLLKVFTIFPYQSVFPFCLFVTDVYPFVSQFFVLFIFKELLHFCPRCPFTLCSVLIDILFHGVKFEAASRS